MSDPAPDPPELTDDGERYLPWMREPTIAYEHLHRYWFAQGLCAGQRVIDLGSGEGYGAALLAETAQSVVGLDLDPAAVRHAAVRYPRPNLRFIEGSMTAVPIPGQGLFDVCVCFEALEHVTEHEKLLDEVTRLLARGGRFLVSTPNKIEYTDAAGFHNPFHVRELYWEEFQALIQGRFAHARWFGQRLHPAGLIFPLGEGAARAEECDVELSDAGYRFADPARKVPRYFLALASDAPLPPVEEIPGSFLVDVSGGMVHEKAVQDLELHLANMRRSHADLEGLIHGLEGSVAAHAAEIKRVAAVHDEVAAELHRREAEHARVVLEREAEHTRVLLERDAQLRAARSHAEELERVVREMADSLPWRVAEQARRVLRRLAPPGSARQRAWTGAVGAVKGRLRRAQGQNAPGGPAGAAPVSCAPLYAGVEHGQWIRSEWEGLFEVRVRLGTYGRANTCRLELALSADPSDAEPIRTATVDAAVVPNNGFQAFTFAPIAGSAGRVYYLSLRSPDATEDNGVGIWWRGALDPDFSAMVDGRREAAAWDCRCRYEARPGEESDPVAAAVHGLDLDAQYQLWLRRSAASEADPVGQREAQAAWRQRPRVSVLMTAGPEDARLLPRAIDSLLAQTYPEWELCVAPPAPGGLPGALADLAGRESRVRLVEPPADAGPPVPLVAALGVAQGEFVALLGAADTLDPSALFEVVRLLQAHPDADVIYTDDDHLAPDGRRVAPFFKPDWAPEMFLSTGYTRRLAVCRRSLVLETGGLGPAASSAPDLDVVLRLQERTDRIHHVPSVLYHFGPAAAAGHPDDDGALRVLASHLERTGTDAVAEAGRHPGAYRVRRRLAGEPLVSIVIPTRDRLDLLSRCLRSIQERSTYRRYEIVIVDNESADPATLAWFADLDRRGAARVLRYAAPFNFAAINNFGVARARGEQVVLLNNDTEVIAPDWLEAMLEHAQRPEIGAVGAKLLYPDRSIQHAGVVLGLGGVAGHSHKHQPGDAPGYQGVAGVVREYSAVTAACVMLRRAVYEEAGGMNDRDLRIAFNDVDLCLRIRARGYRIVYTPYAELYHHESASRGFDLDPDEVAYMRKTWEWQLARDPYYHPSLTTVREDFSLNF